MFEVRVSTIVPVKPVDVLYLNEDLLAYAADLRQSPPPRLCLYELPTYGRNTFWCLFPPPRNSEGSEENTAVARLRQIRPVTITGCLQEGARIDEGISLPWLRAISSKRWAIPMEADDLCTHVTKFEVKEVECLRPEYERVVREFEAMSTVNEFEVTEAQGRRVEYERIVPEIDATRILSWRGPWDCDGTQFGVISGMSSVNDHWYAHQDISWWSTDKPEWHALRRWYNATSRRFRELIGTGEELRQEARARFQDSVARELRDPFWIRAYLSHRVLVTVPDHRLDHLAECLRTEACVHLAETGKCYPTSIDTWYCWLRQSSSPSGDPTDDEAVANAKRELRAVVPTRRSLLRMINWRRKDAVVNALLAQFSAVTERSRLGAEKEAAACSAFFAQISKEGAHCPHCHVNHHDYRLAERPGFRSLIICRCCGWTIEPPGVDRKL